MSPRTLSVVATVLLVAAITYLLLTHKLLAHHPIGFTIQLCAVALMVWARLTFGMRSFHAGGTPTAGGLVVEGPYRYVRHPIYAALLMFVSAGVLWNWTWTGILMGFVTAVTLAIRAVSEEVLLVDVYPEYLEYARRTARLIPYLF